MKVKDGFKFGFGLLLAREVYEILSDPIEYIESMRKAYRKGVQIGKTLNAKLNLENKIRQELLKNKIGSRIE